MGRERVVLAAALVLAIHALPAAAVGEPAAPGAAAHDPGKPGASARSPFGDLTARNRNEPISVRSDKLEFSYRERLLTYTGQVVVTQGDLTLKADVLKVTISEDQLQKLEQIIALGGVEITQGSRAASGGKAVFDQRHRTIELSENAVLTEGPNKISGDRVTVYLDEERSVVEGGDRRVQALLFPGENLEALGHGKEAPQP